MGWCLCGHNEWCDECDINTKDVVEKSKEVAEELGLSKHRGFNEDEDLYLSPQTDKKQ